MVESGKETRVFICITVACQPEAGLNRVGYQQKEREEIMQQDDLPNPSNDENPTTPSMGDVPPPYSGTPNMGDAPTTPEFNAAGTPPMPPAMPVTPGRGGNNGGNNSARNFGIAAIAAVVALALLISAVAFARGAFSTTPTATDILNNASKANLKDATYSIADNLAITFTASGSGGTPTTLNLTGTGKMTKSPARNDVSVSIPLFGSQNTIEIITDGANLYVNLGDLGGLFGSGGNNPAKGKWIEVSLQGQQLPSLQDYSHLKNVKLVGSEKINGKDTWHVQGTLSLDNGTPNPSVSATATAVATSAGLTTQPVTEDLWFLKDSYFPAKLLVHLSATVANVPGFGGSGGAKGSSGPAQIVNDATLTFTAWNSGITITPPSPDQVITLPGIPGLPTPTPTPGS